VGIVRDALHFGHRGEIRLFHGSRTAAGLYLHSVFTAMAKDHSQFTYVPCVSGPDVPPGFMRGRAHHLALASTPPDLRGWHVFAAGIPEMVTEVEAAALRAGAGSSEIHADPYELRSVSQAPVPAKGPLAMNTVGREIAEGSSGGGPRPPKVEPDPEMWQALDEGALLNRILTDFYTRVFEDPILLPYFRGVTKERLVGQVYSFMRDVFTGQKLYFGMRPRTAHHWMVISDELFDHRERMMEECLRRHGLPEHLVQRWRKFEESFRSDVVKASPWKLVVDGVEMPLDGFGEQELLAGTVCDGCGRAVEVGERVRYHLRLGSTYCAECNSTESRPVAPLRTEPSATEGS
jgi:truncated hemoglobin YjbI